MIADRALLIFGLIEIGKRLILLAVLIAAMAGLIELTYQSIDRHMTIEANKPHTLKGDHSYGTEKRSTTESR